MMNKSATVLFAGLVPVLSAACCSIEADDILRDAGSYIDERPDSVLAVLESIPKESLRSRESEALFALTYSMALDKSYIDVSNDSLINVAVKWYCRHGTPDDKLKCYYYQGRIYQNSGDYERAMESFINAERYVKRCMDCSAAGMLYTSKSVIYDYIFDIGKSLANLHSASEYYKAANDTVRYINSLLRLSGSSLIAGKAENAKIYLDTLRTFWSILPESKKSSYYSNLLEISLLDSCSDSMLLITDRYLGEIKDSSIINWIVLAHVYLETGLYEKGLDALNAYRQIDSAYFDDNIYLWLDAELSAKTGEYRTAYESLSRYVDITDETDVNIFESDAKYVEDKMSSMYRIQNRNLWIAVLILGIVASVSAGGLIYIKQTEKIRKKQQEKIRLENEKQRLGSEIALYRNLYERAQEEMTNLQRIRQEPGLDTEIRMSIEERLNVLNRFITASVSKNLTTSAADALDDYLKDKDRFIYSTRLSFIITHPGFVSYLKKSGLTEMEIGYCCLYCIGMNGKEIASYLNKKSFYNSSSAIREKLGMARNKTNLDIFLRKKMAELG